MEPRKAPDAADRYSLEAAAARQSEMAREHLLERARNIADPLEEAARAMTDDDLEAAIRSIRGNPKRAGSRARRLSISETLALAALMAESGRRGL